VNRSDLSHYALSGCLASALLAGCSGSQPPIGAPGAMPQTSAVATHADRGKSWMKPGISSGSDLLYVADNEGRAFVLTYPQGDLVGQLDFPYSGNSGGLCSDSNGHVFVPDMYEIVEYAHGGTQPTATLDDDYIPMGCSVDPTTGNLAVTNRSFSGGRGNVAIYADAQGDPTYYSDSEMLDYNYCGYDNRGNLFVSGSDTSTFAELPSGGGAVESITLNKTIYGSQVQWDGRYITVQAEDWIYRVSVSGSAGTIVGRTRLKDLNPNSVSQSWIQGNTAIAPVGHNNDRFGFWKYPHGGKAFAIVPLGRKANLIGATVSVDGSH
jgi:hypothetical protein